MLKIVKRSSFFELVNKEKNISIITKKFKLGINYYIGERTRGCNENGGPMDYFSLGDNVIIHHSSRIMVPSFSVLDYTKINNNFFVYGTQKLEIGYNCWIGSGIILDTLGGLEIKNNVCIASRSQIYSHAKFGDTLYGCRINSIKKTVIGDDVWIAPNCVIIMSKLEDKSMVLAGSVLTKNTITNHIYAGIPVKDISKKTGYQFENNINFENIYLKLKNLLRKFYLNNPDCQKGKIKIWVEKPDEFEKGVSNFVVKDRKYTKTQSNEEIQFMKYLLPDKAKFIPY